MKPPYRGWWFVLDSPLDDDRTVFIRARTRRQALARLTEVLRVIDHYAH